MDMDNEIEDHELLEEKEYYISLTRNEVLFLDDSITLMIEREMINPSEGTHLSSMRVVAPTAQLAVPIELVDKLAMGVLYTTDPDNVGKDVELLFQASELYQLREIAQSFVKVGQESVGFNLKKKFYSALFKDEYKTNKLVDELTIDTVLNNPIRNI